MVLFCKSGSFRAKVDAFGHNGCIRVKVILFGPTRLYSGKKCCTRSKVVVIKQIGCIRAKVVALGNSGCIRAKRIYSGKSDCIRE